MNYPIYLDYNATCPIDEKVLNKMLPFLKEHFGNAASAHHAYGWKAAEAVAEARQQIAELLGASEKEIVFTSGATESVNLAIKGVFEALSHRGNHIITAQTEHKAVIDSCKHLQKIGADITFLPVEKDGSIDLNLLENSIRKETILISLMAANNETGVLHPIREISEIAQKHQVLFHTDATQAIGKIPFDVTALNIDLLSLSGHKMYAPKGIGALFIRKKIQISPQIDGGRHERGLRSGTLNVPGIVALGEASVLAIEQTEHDCKRISLLRDCLEKAILEAMPNAFVNGNTKQRLPNTTNICFGSDIDGEHLLLALNKIAVSNGSACNSASTEPSYVLKAMGLDNTQAYSSIRFSLGRMSQETTINTAIQHIAEVLKKY